MNEWIKTKNELPRNTVLVKTKVTDSRGDH